jgi:hypothetical protein
MQLLKRAFQKNKFGITTIFCLSFGSIVVLSCVIFWQHFIHSTTYNPPTISLAVHGPHIYNVLSSYYGYIIFSSLIFPLMSKFMNNDAAKHWFFGLYSLLVFFLFYKIYDFKVFIAKTMIENKEPPNPISEISTLEFALVSSFLVMFCLYIYTFLLKTKKVDIEEITHEAS